jgi:hypothetical protein
MTLQVVRRSNSIAKSGAPPVTKAHAEFKKKERQLRSVLLGFSATIVFFGCGAASFFLLARR